MGRRGLPRGYRSVFKVPAPRRRRNRSGRGRRRPPTLLEVVLGVGFIVALGVWHAIPPAVREHRAFVPALAAVAALVVALLILRKVRRALRIRALRMDQVDLMTGTEFEDYVGRVLAHQGFRVKRLGGSGDQGCDLLLTRDGRRTACQVKRYAKSVGNGAVQEAVASMAFHRCDAAMVVTNSWFTSGARALARANGCRLVARDELSELAAAFRDRDRRRLL